MRRADRGASGQHWAWAGEIVLSANAWAVLVSGPRYRARGSTRSPQRCGPPRAAGPAATQRWSRPDAVLNAGRPAGIQVGQLFQPVAFQAVDQPRRAMTRRQAPSARRLGRPSRSSATSPSTAASARALLAPNECVFDSMAGTSGHQQNRPIPNLGKTFPQRLLLVDGTDPINPSGIDVLVVCRLVVRHGLGEVAAASHTIPGAASTGPAPPSWPMGESSVMRALVVHQPGGPAATRLQQLPAPSQTLTRS